MSTRPKIQPGAPTPRTVRETLNLRVRPELRSLIDQAAELTGKSRTDFVLDASRRAAEEAVLDRTLVLADPDAFAAFCARLDAPPAANDRLRRTMTRKPPWDET